MQIFTQLVLLKGLQAAIFVQKKNKSMKTKNQPYHKLLIQLAKKYMNAVWKQRG